MRLNVLICGKTGAGKSVLIEEICEFDKQGRAPISGVGRPFTKRITAYSNPEGTLLIHDTPGFETEQLVSTMVSVNNELGTRMASFDLEERLHVVWYLVRSNGPPLEKFELGFIRKLCGMGLTVIVVLTMCYADNNEVIRLDSYLRNHSIIAPIVRVLARKMDLVGSNGNVPSFGVPGLIGATLEMYPEIVAKMVTAMLELMSRKCKAEIERCCRRLASAPRGRRLRDLPGLLLEGVSDIVECTCECYRFNSDREWIENVKNTMKSNAMRLYEATQDTSGWYWTKTIFSLGIYVQPRLNRDVNVCISIFKTLGSELSDAVAKNLSSHLKTVQSSKEKPGKQCKDLVLRQLTQALQHTTVRDS